MIFMFDSRAILKGYTFTCIQCGCCCYQAGGVDLTEKERKEIGQHPSIVPLKDNPDSLYTYRIRPLSNGKCPFLENNLCTIYEKRPEICRRFPLTLRYVPEIGYLYGTLVCCGAEIKSESSTFPFEEYIKTMDRRFLSHFEKLEKRAHNAALALSKNLNAQPSVADVETVIRIWDFIGDFAFADDLERENLQWMSWAIMKVWYQFYLDVLHKERVLTGKNLSSILSVLRKQFPDYVKPQLDQLEKVKETAIYRANQSGKDSDYTFYTCKKNPEILRVPLSDAERSHARFTAEALELSRTYYSFLARRNVRASPFRSFVVPVAFVPEILHRIMTEVTGLAALLAKHQNHSIITYQDLFDVIKLVDDPHKFDFFRKQVLESYGMQAFSI